MDSGSRSSRVSFHAFSAARFSWCASAGALAHTALTHTNSRAKPPIHAIAHGHSHFRAYGHAQPSTYGHARARAKSRGPVGHQRQGCRRPGAHRHAGG